MRLEKKLSKVKIAVSRRLRDISVSIPSVIRQEVFFTVRDLCLKASIVLTKIQYSNDLTT